MWWIDFKINDEKEIIIDFDEGIWEGVIVEFFVKFKLVFVKDGSIYVGNVF